MQCLRRGKYASILMVQNTAGNFIRYSSRLEHLSFPLCCSLVILQLIYYYEERTSLSCEIFFILSTLLYTFHGSIITQTNRQKDRWIDWLTSARTGLEPSFGYGQFVYVCPFTKEVRPQIWANRGGCIRDSSGYGG